MQQKEANVYGGKGFAIGLVAVGIASAVSLIAPVQLVFLISSLAIAATVSLDALVVFTACVIPIIPLLRRLLAGDSGYVSFDPLAALPVALLFVILLRVVAQRDYPSPHRPFLRGILAAVAASAMVSLLISGSFTPTAVFYLASVLIGLALAVLLPSELARRLAVQVLRVVPFLAAISALYGLIQYAYLPSWDRAWMLATGESSLGAPYPGQVRVFGPAESPGPFAAYVSLGFLVILVGSWRGGLALRLLRLGALGLLFGALVLSGVRVALVGIVASLAFWGVRRLRGALRVLPALIGVVLYGGLNFLLERVLVKSSILSDNRYDQFDPATDASVQERLRLLAYVRNAFSYAVGNPGVGRFDNLAVDFLVNYGVVAGISITLFWLIMLIAAFRGDGELKDSRVEAAIVFTCVYSVAGDPFVFSFVFYIALLSGQLFGSSGPAAAVLGTQGVASSRRLEF